MQAAAVIAPAYVALDLTLLLVANAEHDAGGDHADGARADECATKRNEHVARGVAQDVVRPIESLDDLTLRGPDARENEPDTKRCARGDERDADAPPARRPDSRSATTEQDSWRS